MTKPTSPLQSCRLRTKFSHPRSRSRAVSLSDAKNNPFRKMLDTLYRGRQLWSGNESVHKRQLCSGDVGFVTWRSSSYSYNGGKCPFPNVMPKRTSFLMQCLKAHSTSNVLYKKCILPIVMR